jgi:trehalose utilization protein
LGLLAGSVPRAAEASPLRVRVWCEGTAPKSVYPDDVDGALARDLGRRGLDVTRARLADGNAGLSDAALDATDVLVWWGCLRHDEVPADRAAAVVARVKAGRLGFVALHGSCRSTPFKQLMGTSCEPARWREDGRPEHVAIQEPRHPIAQGIASFTIPKADMFAEPFAVPAPESVVLVSSWDDGTAMRSGLTWTVERGRVVYLRYGHAAFPVLFHPAIRQVIANSVAWAARRA